MLTKVLIILMMIAMVIALFSALYFMFKEDKKSMAKALSWRIGIWVVLLALLFIGVSTGVIKPSNTIPLPVATDSN